MTVFCASGCSIRGEHLADCDGTAVNRDGEVIECRGCLPRPAEAGRLCGWCWGRLQSAVRTLPSLVEHLCEVAESAVSSPLGRMGSRRDDRSEERDDRSEERRVGKECRSRWSPYH